MFVRVYLFVIDLFPCDCACLRVPACVRIFVYACICLRVFAFICTNNKKNKSLLARGRDRSLKKRKTTAKKATAREKETEKGS